MNEKRKREIYLKESTNPLNNEEDNQKITNSSNQGSIGSGKELKEKSDITVLSSLKTEKTSFSNKNNSDSSLKVNNLENIKFYSQQNYNNIMNKKDRYKLEKKMKDSLNNIYKEMKIDKNFFKNKNNGSINNKNKNQYSSELINKLNKNKKYLLKKLMIILISLLILVLFNIIFYFILYKNNLNNLPFYIASLSLSNALFGLTLFLILLIYFGIFRHYNTSNIFRFLCLINLCLSISLFIIHALFIINLKGKIDFQMEKKSTKIIILSLIFIITGIIIGVNPLIGMIAKDSLLIIGGCKNEDLCPERRVKYQGKKTKDKYVYFNDELDDNDINKNSLKKFHACINSNNN